MKTIFAAAMAACSIAAAPAAQAAELIHIEGGAITALPGEFELTFDAGGGDAMAKFQIIGFRTVDGANVANDLTDTFSLLVNGVEVLRGAYDLGGGGDNITFLAPSGAQIAVHSGQNIGDGGTVDVTTALTLAAGANTLTFRYATRVPQSPEDEFWAVGAVTVNGAAAGASVPEPSAWALMLLGFGGMGAALRRRPLLLQK